MRLLAELYRWAVALKGRYFRLIPKRRLRKPTSRQQSGESAEKIAEQFLRQQGLNILGRNLRIGHHEIDLLAQEGETPIIVEVRYRSQGGYLSAAQTLNRKKRQHLRVCARTLMRQNGWMKARIDAVFIDEGKPPQWVRSVVNIY